MALESRKYLYDILQAVKLLREFTSGKSFDDYASDALLRSAVERQFEVAGEAVAQLAKLDGNLVARITDYRQIVAFRNVLIHGYADVDDRLVWDIIETKLPALLHEVEALVGTL